MPNLPKRKRQSSSSSNKGDDMVRYVATLLRDAGFIVERETVALGRMIDVLARRMELGREKSYMAECKDYRIGTREATEAVGHLYRPSMTGVADGFWLIGREVSPAARDLVESKGPLFRVFALDEFEAALRTDEWAITRQQNPPKRSARTKAGRAVLANQKELSITIGALIALLDDRLNSLRNERPNSPEGQATREHAIFEYEALKRNIEALRDTISQFRVSKANEPALVKSVETFSDGVYSWWAKSHERILDTGFGVGLFASAMGVCSLAGAHGNTVTVIAGLLAGGKPLADALKGFGKALFK
jgi:hypothetical protein